MSDAGGIDGISLPQTHAVLEMLTTADTSATACALLTPAIKSKLKELEPGQVLLVRVDDPSAYLDIKAWCSLTGNSLLATDQEGEGVLTFFIKKQEK